MMFLTVLLVTLAFSATYARDSRIVNGEDANVGEFLHQASLEAFYYPCLEYGPPCFFGLCFGDCVAWGEGSYSHICGAAIVANKWCVTAAHCVEGGGDYRILINRHHRGDDVTPDQIKNIADIKIHENWESNGDGFPNDIALLRTTQDMPSDNVIPLAEKGESFVGETCWISGWGYTDGSAQTLPGPLQKTDGKILSNDECSNDHWGTSINDGHICIDRADSGACNGDSGGPMTCRQKLAGVTSWGRSGCDPKWPSVYTNIAYFRDWIDKNMN